MIHRRVVTFALFTCALSVSACLSPPDDGMALGPETAGETVDQALHDAQPSALDTDVIRVNDKGLIQSVETIFSAAKIKETHLYTITGIDTYYIYFKDDNVRTFETTAYRMQRPPPNSPSASPTPAPIADPSPSPTPSPSPSPHFAAEMFEKIQTTVARWYGKIHSRVTLAFSKIKIETSTALGESNADLPHQRYMSPSDLEIKRQILSVIQGTEGGDPDPQSGVQDTAPTTSRYFGLKVTTHSVITNNCTQIKDCKVKSTHIEFNELSTTKGQTTQVHWVYEISKEVPGLFSIMNRCGSAVAILNNVQVPFMECQLLDTFQFGNK